jgi:hypothetical protein
MTRISAKGSVGVGVASVLVVGAGWWWVSRPPTEDGVRLDGPIESCAEGGVSEAASAPDGYRVDWAEIELVNRAPDPATITKVMLIPGFASSNLLHSDGAFILGLDRAFGGGTTDAPSDKSYWGVDPVPAIGYEVPGTEQDEKGSGVELMLRLGNGNSPDASFARVDVYYTWHEDEYKAVFVHGLLICDAQPPKFRKAKLCREEHPTPKAIDWPSSKWDDAGEEG